MLEDECPRNAEGSDFQPKEAHVDDEKVEDRPNDKSWRLRIWLACGEYWMAVEGWRYIRSKRLRRSLRDLAFSSRYQMHLVGVGSVEA